MIEECNKFLDKLINTVMPNSHEIESMIKQAEKLRTELGKIPEITDQDLIARFNFIKEFLSERWHSSFAWNWEKQAINYYSDLARKRFGETQ